MSTRAFQDADLDRFAGNETKGDVTGLGVLTRVIQHDNALGAEEIHCA